MSYAYPGGGVTNGPRQYDPHQYHRPDDFSAPGNNQTPTPASMPSEAARAQHFAKRNQQLELEKQYLDAALTESEKEASFYLWTSVALGAAAVGALLALLLVTMPVGR